MRNRSGRCDARESPARALACIYNNRIASSMSWLPPPPRPDSLERLRTFEVGVNRAHNLRNAQAWIPTVRRGIILATIIVVFAGFEVSSLYFALTLAAFEVLEFWGSRRFHFTRPVASEPNRTRRKSVI